MYSNDAISYEVFVADPIPLNVNGRLPNGEHHMFSPLASTVIYGKNDAVLTEAPLTINQAKALGDWIEARGKNLTHIFASHGHGDHRFTAGLLAERFGARIVAAAGTIEQMRLSASIRDVFWDKLWPEQIPPSPITVVTVPENHFTLEGHDVLIVEVGHGDTDDSAVLYVADLALVVAGDVIYNGVHQYLGESANGGRDGWRHAIDSVKALQPRWIVASHKNEKVDDDAARVIEETRRYLNDADDQLAKTDTARGFFNAMLQHYPNRHFGATTLWAGTNALYALRDGGDVIQASLDGWFK
jgi:glyoxylase-like metal-dependent hydrolase (beta-lactamase superfamily II)